MVTGQNGIVFVVVVILLFFFLVIGIFLLAKLAFFP